MIAFLFRLSLSLVAFLATRTESVEKLSVVSSRSVGFAWSAMAEEGTVASPKASPSLEEPATEAETSSTFGNFLRLGVRHILTGYDHLLFLLGLLLVCDRVRSVVVIISAFTLAHTATLALSTLNVFVLPDRLVEPLIAATIMGIGIENLLGRGDQKRRGFFAFCFGLIHGFAFAGVLRSLLAVQPSTRLILPLFSFNLGVEMGQIAVALVVVPALGWLRQFSGFRHQGTRGLSGLIALIGLYWLIERTILA